MVDVSIVILTKNEEKNIKDCLSKVFEQRTSFSYEVIVIDSGSKDKTVDFALTFPVRLIRIKPEEFGHGKTRNLGAKLGAGRYIVYLTADAMPAGDDWLGSLVANLEDDDQTAGAYSRNIPRPDCNPGEARYIAKAWGTKKQIKSAPAGEKENLKKVVFFSDISSCIKRSIWEKFPFSEDIIMAEDQDWSKRVLEAGYKIVYESDSIVIHSHNYSLKQLFKRYSDAGAAHGQIFRDNNNVYFPLIPFFAVAVTLLDINFMLKKSHGISSVILWIPAGIIRHIFEATGFWFGLHSAMLPRIIKKKFTMYGK